MPFKHGMINTSTYVIWGNMIQRSTNPNTRSWSRYGGRGVTVCERWRTFANFLADMGERPAGLTLDRIDNDGNYEPSNCRWSTRTEQQNNRSLNTHCRRGHEFTADNTYFDAKGRKCRACRSESGARYRAQLRERVAELKA